MTGLPTNGSTVYVRLWTQLAGIWQSNDYTFTAGSGLAATLISPTNGATLSNPQTFTWTSVSGATEYWVGFGSTQGGTQYGSSSMGMSTSVVVTWEGAAGLPLHLRLWTQHGGTWRYNDYAFVTPQGSLGAGTSGADTLQISRGLLLRSALD